MSGKPRYIYFNARARGELPRLICAAAEIDFVDERVEDSEWVPKYKSMTPYGQLPVLEVDGKMFAQKMAISYYFAREGGLYPTNATDLELLNFEHILLFVQEVLEDYVSAREDEHFYNKPETLPKVKMETFPQKLPIIEKLLKENGTGYFVGNELSIVDLCAFDLFEQVADEMGSEYMDSYPLIKAHFEKVCQIENIKSYLAKRPSSVYNW